MCNVGLAAAAAIKICLTANYYICICNRIIKIEKKGKGESDKKKAMEIYCCCAEEKWGMHDYHSPPDIYIHT